jgi:hypothetical protein
MIFSSRKQYLYVSSNSNYFFSELHQKPDRVKCGQDISKSTRNKKSLLKTFLIIYIQKPN